MANAGIKNLVHFTKDDPKINRNGAPPYKRALRKANSEWVARMQHILFNEPESEFMEFLSDPTITAAERLVAKLVERVYKTGDPVALGILFDRLLGKQDTKVKVSAVTQTEVVASLSDDELARRAALLDEAGE